MAKARVRPGQPSRKGILQKELFVSCRPEACRQLPTALGPLALNFAVLHQSPCPKARAISIVSYHDHSACFDRPSFPVDVAQTSITRARRSISARGTNCPCPAPGHDSHIVSQASRLSRFEFQKGHVRHCAVGAAYTPQRRVLGSKNVQSPFSCSVREIRPSTTLVCCCRIVSTVSPRSSAICTTSASLTQTTPGAPVQQSPHCVHVKLSPSLYHGNRFPMSAVYASTP